MQERSSGTTSTAAMTTQIELDESTTTVDFADKLPLRLIQSEAIPPAPTRSESTIDWLPDFSGYAWIAYGASSLLVISHFPNPLSQEETLIGPMFRQVLELSADGSSTVSAVSWSPASPSVGDLAAALDNCVGLFSNNSGSFSWSQTAVLVQSTKVEAIQWTGSGDGIITGGVEVILWKKHSKSWEISWKFKAEVPQTLISATFSIDGVLATAPSHKLHGEESSSWSGEASNCVLVCYNNGKSKFSRAELRHPMPVSMIQWRPLIVRQSKSHTRHSPTHVLLTCCLDGTARLWSEITDGRVRRIGNDTLNPRTMKRSFHVVAVIEINQTLGGILGSSVYVRWTEENNDIVTTSRSTNQSLSSGDECYQNDKVGSCEWLVAFGPHTSVTFWAIHCLDDVTPMRFPRVTLFKRQDLIGANMETSNFILNKVVISRNKLSGPPNSCSLVKLLPCSSLCWSQYYSQIPNNEEGVLSTSCIEESFLSCYADGVLNIDGHFGKVLQVAVHPYRCDVEIAVSIDTDGLLLFWSLSTLSNCIMGLPSFNPAWKVNGRITKQDLHPKYTSLSWAPSVVDEDLLLLAGHDEGIDCIIVNFSSEEKYKILCQSLCTIPLNFCQNGPCSIYAAPLPSESKRSFNVINILLLALWENDFRASSWKITINCSDANGNGCESDFDTRKTIENSSWAFEYNLSGKVYNVSVRPCSSLFPDPHDKDVITSIAVACPITVVPDDQNKSSVNELSRNHSAYHIATGCTDGSLKLWRSILSEQSGSNLQWELVGMLAVLEGPIKAISLADGGRKIATMSLTETSSTVRIWESVHLVDEGCFLLEDTLIIDGEVVALNWLTMGTGQPLLGVCLQNELRVYAERRKRAQRLMISENQENSIWFCIAFAHTSSPIRSFYWAPRATIVVVYDGYFSLFSQWLFLADKIHESVGNSSMSKENFQDAIFIASDIHNFEDSLPRGNLDGRFILSMKVNAEVDILSSIFIGSTQRKCDLSVKSAFCTLQDVADKLSGPLPVYHPEALLTSIQSGHWQRARLALQHLVEYFASSDRSLNQCCAENCGHVIPLIHLSNYYGAAPSTRSSDTSFQWSENSFSMTSNFQPPKRNNFADNWGSEPSTGTSDLPGSGRIDCVQTQAVQKLYDIAAITSMEKTKILAIVDLLREFAEPHLASAYKSLDEPGRRFWVAVRFQKLYFFRKFGRSASIGELNVHSDTFAWALHSDCQENLVNTLLPSEPSWQEMQNLGVGFWYTNATQLRSKMEKLARQQYMRSKDPKACALLYIALNRIQVLAGLFKLSKNEKDKPLVGFLSRNFQEERNKAAALKNAYVLMGRHQLELAVAFFLLGGDATSAVNVCAKTLGDEQLALVICRLVEGYGGPLERHLIVKVLLPSATAKGDYWLASFLEWVLGNYTRSFMTMFGIQEEFLINNSTILSNRTPFWDPKVGQYCQMVAMKNNMKKAVGEDKAIGLARWAALMSSTALNRCGLPIEALECLSSSVSMFGGSDQRSSQDIGKTEALNKILKPSSQNSSNWILGDTSFHLEMHAKLHLAMRYISILLREHPFWPNYIIAPLKLCESSGEEIQQHSVLLENFQRKLADEIAYFEQKFSLLPPHLINMIVMSLSNRGLLFIGYHILQGYASQNSAMYEKAALESSLLYRPGSKFLLKATEEMSCLFSRYILACSITSLPPESSFFYKNLSGENTSSWLTTCQFYMQGLLRSIWRLRSTLTLFSDSCEDDFMKISSTFLDLSEYSVYLASAWLQRDYEALVVIVKPLLLACKDGHAADLMTLLHQIKELLTKNTLSGHMGSSFQLTQSNTDQAKGIMTSLSEGIRWKIIRASLWGHVTAFLERQLSSLEILETSYSFGPFHSLTFSLSNPNSSEPHDTSLHKQIKQVPVILSKLLETTCTQAFSSSAKHLVSYLMQNMEHEPSEPIRSWLQGFDGTSPALHEHLDNGLDSRGIIDFENESTASEVLWDLFADPKAIRNGVATGNYVLQRYVKPELSKDWSNLCRDITGDPKSELSCDMAGRFSNSPSGSGTELSVQRHASPADNITSFLNPKEVYRKNGELLEALCINSIQEKETALASNRKGIVFFNWRDDLPLRNHSNYIWAEADWPQNGWAGSESTPVPTAVSPGVGLGSKKGSHLGLGGATIGLGPSTRPGKGLTGTGTIGVPGYAGIGVPALGWGIQEDFEVLKDPPATVESIHTMAFSSHPSRPFFLVGSTNTHVYLWEFGKEKATATYGVLPAANVPPPYALASISAVKFDQFGHRFATAALDGTICTWQLEVGGRNNIFPTESSLCFNNHASDVTYVTASGSLIAATGSNSNGINVIIWDTLAPPATSRASIMCHQGGARSLGVFDNDIGSGSVSPFIVTGGKGGDVGLHDFRYIATGKTKKHRYFASGEADANASLRAGMQNKIGEQNRDGMLWYIPNAHSGSVTKIATIPNTSLFLTGGKDGDVKLWDAKAAKLLCHWPKLHERHTFLQPSSRGFGGVVRAGVTDIQVVSDGFLTCGGDGSVKLVEIKGKFGD